MKGPFRTLAPRRRVAGLDVEAGFARRSDLEQPEAVPHTKESAEEVGLQLVVRTARGYGSHRSQRKEQLER